MTVDTDLRIINLFVPEVWELRWPLTQCSSPGFWQGGESWCAYGPFPLLFSDVHEHIERGWVC